MDQTVRDESQRENRWLTPSGFSPMTNLTNYKTELLMLKLCIIKSTSSVIIMHHHIKKENTRPAACV